ncbi:hypothetical protein FIBSPDRAFT_1051779 [Athelia psychrophila]|uniref:Uncharacterized protein n=1 Tax=Athelia psychrophila TaxID=1759441 RepID=A0A165YHL4_9AGAM|nr:hypothetical protein FIBSPDRAFT_1051779 [Fibularhizoctonia sp. CBS 109695]
MDFESDMEELAAAPVPLSQFPSNPWYAGDDADFVKWQGSQSNSVALNALIHEAAQPARRSPRNHRTQHLRTALTSGFSFSSSSSSSSASSASSAPRTKPRMSRIKVRHNPVRTASPSVIASTPVSTLCSDPMQFLQTLKGVSEKVRVDETMRAKKRVVSGEMKAPASIATAIRSGKQKENLRRTASAMKDRPRSPMPLSASRSLPTMDTGDVNMYMNMDISAQMDVDDDLNSHLISAPSISRPPLAATTTEYPTSLKREMLSSKPKLFMPPPAAPKAQPPPTLLRTIAPTRAPSPPKPEPPRKLSQPPVAAAPTIPEPPPASPPRTQLLSSQRPRALGMRRAFPAYSATTTSSQSLPEKQRAFKVPLAKPSCPPTTMVSTTVFPAKSTRERQVAAPFPSPPSPLGADADAISKGEGIRDGDGSSSPSPGSPSADPDSSYGDMSFDMDALEETMQKYD